MKVHETHVKVRHSETGLYSIAQHFSYAVWLEMAQQDYLATFGITYAEMEQQGLFFPQIDSHIRYKKPAFYEDVLTIRIWIRKLSMAKAVFSFEILRGEELIATAEVTNAFMNNALKPVPLRRCCPSLYEAMARIMDEEEAVG